MIFGTGKRRKLAALMILLSVILGMMFSVEYKESISVSAGTDGHNTKTVDNGDGTKTVYTIYHDGIKMIQKEILTFDFKNGVFFKMTGKHVDSGASIHYYTNAYNFTLDKTEGEPTSHTNRIRLDRYTGNAWKPDVSYGGTIITEYNLPWSTMTEGGVVYRGIYEAAEQLARTKYGENNYKKELADSGGIILYMSNIFQVMKRTFDSDGNIVSDKVITGQDDINTFNEMKAAQPWSKETMDLLGAYYDIPLKINKIYYPTYKVHTNCVECAKRWVADGYPDMNTFNNLCSLHDNSSGIWCEKTIYGEKAGDGYEAYEYTKLSGIVKQIQGRTYQIRNGTRCTSNANDGKINTGDKWNFDGTCSSWGTDGTPVVCNSVLLRINEGGTPIDSGVTLSDARGMYQLYSYGEKMQLKIIGGGINGAGAFDRVVIMPYVKESEDKQVTVKYVYAKDGSILNNNVAVKTVEKGQSFSYTVNVSTLPIGTKVTSPFTAKYVYGDPAVVKYIDSGKELSAAGMTFTNIHEKNTKAVLYVRLDTDSTVVPPGSETLTTTSVIYFDPHRNGLLTSDIFNVSSAIPSTEEMYAQIGASNYLIELGLKKVEGDKNYVVTFTQSYVLKYKSPDLKKDLKKNGTVTSTVTVNRKYTYYEMIKLEYYTLYSAVINSNALASEAVISIGASYPKCTYEHYSGESGHLHEPVIRAMSLPPVEITSDTATVPAIPQIDEALAQAEAEGKIGQIKVRSDKLKFDGKIIIDSDWVEEKTAEPSTGLISPPSVVNAKKYGLIIPAYKSNQTYSGAGTVTYRCEERFASSRGNYLNFSVSVNNVNVHTPVYCDGIITSDNYQYTQTAGMNNSIPQLVIGRSDGAGSAGHENDSCDFTVRISNTGQHISSSGYGNRDYNFNYSHAEGGSYIAREGSTLMNQVRFPFDVYEDVNNDRIESNDRFIPSYTWCTIGTTVPRYYIPMWVTEGDHTVEFRSIAVNGKSYTTKEGYMANLSPAEYVAVDMLNIHVSGKLYGLTLYDVSSKHEWEDVFKLGYTLKKNYPSKYADGTISYTDYDREKMYYYTTGKNNELGFASGRTDKFVMPLISGSNIKFQNLGVLKAGYTWRFKLDTTGTMMSFDDSGLKLTPTFYWVSEDGTRREKVNLYYSEAISGKQQSLVRIGGAVDALNMKNNYAKNAVLAIPEQELKDTALLRGYTKESDWTTNRGLMYTYGGMTSNVLFKTFSNRSYANKILSSSSWSAVRADGHTYDDLVKLKQSYYFEYSIPASFKALPQTFDLAAYGKSNGITYQEDFWKKDGYIVVNFDITAYDYSNTKYLTYSNLSNAASKSACNMWQKEGFMRTRTDYYGISFAFDYGDLFMIYTDETIYNDYIVDHLN